MAFHFAQMQFYYSTHNKNRRITVASVVFEQANPEIRPLQSYNLDRTVNGDRRI